MRRRAALAPPGDRDRRPVPRCARGGARARGGDRRRRAPRDARLGLRRRRPGVEGQEARRPALPGLRDARAAPGHVPRGGPRQPASGARRCTSARSACGRAPGGGLVLDPDDEASGVGRARGPHAALRRARHAGRRGRGPARPRRRAARASGPCWPRFHAGQPRAGARPARRSRRCAPPCARRSTTSRPRAPPPGAGDVARCAARWRRCCAPGARSCSSAGARGLVADGHGDLRAEHVLLTDPLAGRRRASSSTPALRVADVAVRPRLPRHGPRGRRAPRPGRGARRRATATAGGDPGDDRAAGRDGLLPGARRAPRSTSSAPGRATRRRRRAAARLDQALRVRAGARAGRRLLAVCGRARERQDHAGRARCARRATWRAPLLGPPPQGARRDRRRGDRAPAAAYAHERDPRDLPRARRARGGGAGDRARRGASTRRWATRPRATRCAPGSGRRRRRAALRRVPGARGARRRAARASRARPPRASPTPARTSPRGCAAAWRPLDEVPAERHLVLRADRPPTELLRELSAWLDRAAVP